MNKRKYQSAGQFRKEILRSYVKQFTSSRSAEIPWQMLEKLIQDCPYLEDEFRQLVIAATSERSVEKLFDLQHRNDPQKYESWRVYKDTNAVLSFLKKYPFGKVAGLDPLGKAVDRFWEAERLCRSTNKRLKWYRDKGYRLQNKGTDFHGIFHSARQMISNWLGPLDLNQIYDYTRHGPGGSIGVTGDGTTAVFKYAADQYSVTTRGLPYAEAAILADPLWRRYVSSPEGLNLTGDHVPAPADCRLAVQDRLRVVNYNKVTFVPKTAQMHRAIAVEPLMNVFLQLGVGDLLTRKLAKQGLNLRSQARNQLLARAGSNWGGVPDLRPVTLDLSMASDTLSIELVRELLPEEWFNLLDDLRSPSGMMDNVEVPYAKFSSMGNGFTFQLESMIFYALTCAVAKQLGFPHRKVNADSSSIAVYGDDIICPAGMALVLVDVLTYSGFVLNPDKSFLFGPFRESCGTDWFEGRDVRPLYLKRKVQNAKDLVFVANLCGRIYHNIDDTSCDMAFRAFLARFCVSSLPALVRNNLLGPPTEDLEGHLHVSWDEGQRSPFVLWDKEKQTWSYRSVKSKAREFRAKDGPLLLQLMDYNSCRSDFTSDVSVVNNNTHNRMMTLLSFESCQMVSKPLNAGAVYRRKATRLILTTQTSDSWRNV